MASCGRDAGLLLWFCAVDTSRAEGESEAPAPTPARTPPPLPDEGEDVGVASWNPTRGPADAPITVVVFGEYLCPFCKKLMPTLDRLVEAYGDRVRIVWRHWIVHPPAGEAALAAIAAGMQGRFWTFHALLFERQTELRVLYEGGTVPWSSEWAAEAGLDVERFERDRQGPEAAALLEEDKAEGQRVGAYGTPSPFVNGRKLLGAVPPSWFGAWIDELLGVEGPTLVPADDPSGPAPSGAPQPTVPGVRAPPPLPDEGLDVGTASWNPTRGPADAPIAVVVFCEFLCPFCKKLMPTLDRLREAYGDRVRIVWRHWLVHPPAREAALAAIAAGMQGRFWEFQALLFERQSELRVSTKAGPWRGALGRRGRPRCRALRARSRGRRRRRISWRRIWRRDDGWAPPERRPVRQRAAHARSRPPPGSGPGSTSCWASTGRPFRPRRTRVPLDRRLRRAFARASSVRPAPGSLIRLP